MQRLENLTLLSSLLPAALLSLLAVSCQVDDTYSLENIQDLDTEMTLFSNNIEVPVGNVKMITLGSIIDLDDNDLIYTDENGNYGLRMAGAETSSTSIDIPAVELSKFQVGKTTLLEFVFPSSVVGMSVPTYSDNVTITSKESPITIENGIPEGIVDIRSISLNAPVDIDFKLSGGYLTLKKDFTFTFPSCLSITSQSADFQVVSANTLKATKDIRISDGYKVSVTVTGITFPAGSIVPSGSGKKILINDKIVANGTVNVDGAAFTTIPSSISMDFAISSGNVVVNSVDAKLAITETAEDISIEVGELPEEIKEASLVLSDPVVRFSVSNSSPFAVMLNANITSKKAGVPVCSPVAISNVVIAANANTDVYICKSSHAVPSGAVKVVAESIGELLKTIPDEFVISGISSSVTTPGYATVTSKTTYKVGMDYDVSTLLAFETGTALGFNYTVDGLSMDLDSLSIEDMDLSMDFVSSIPLDLTLNAKAFDSEGAEMEGANITVNAVVKGGTIEAPATSPVTINIKAGDSLSDLDSIVLDFRAAVPASLSGVALNVNQGIAINNIVARMNGGITVTP